MDHPFTPLAFIAAELLLSGIPYLNIVANPLYDTVTTIVESLAITTKRQVQLERLGVGDYA